MTLKCLLAHMKPNTAKSAVVLHILVHEPLHISSCVPSAGGPAELIIVGDKQMLGQRASAAQVLQLLNSRPGLKQKRKQTHISLQNHEVQLHDMYNTVQAQGGASLVCKCMPLPY